jgi:hypothetical protein
VLSIPQTAWGGASIRDAIVKNTRPASETLVATILHDVLELMLRLVCNLNSTLSWNAELTRALVRTKAGPDPPDPRRPSLSPKRLTFSHRLGLSVAWAGPLIARHICHPSSPN